MATPRCPRDGEALTRLDAVLGAGTSGFSCPRCAGVLVDWPTAEKFFTSLALALADVKTLVGKEALAGKQPATCPACAENAFKPLTLKDTQLDLCEACGHLWFDRGELKRLAGAKAVSLPDAPKVLAGETSRSAGTFEMWWDCAHCETKSLLGKSNRFCPNCGAQQDARRRYFPPDGQEQAFNGEFDGADKFCPACGTPNGAMAHNCRHCGSPMDGAGEVGRVADAVNAPPPPRAAAATPTKRSWWLYALIAFLAVSCCFCGVALTWKKDAKATVSGHRWERTVDVESYDAVNDSAWCDSMPMGAYNVSRHREQRSTKKIADGETCSTRKVDRGDGTFERREECRPKYREEPVYDERCTYVIDRWHTVRTARANGGSLSDSPQWPRTNLRQTGQCRGCEREGGRHEKYTLELKGPGGESWDCELNEAKWRGVREGAVHDVQVGVLTGTVDCSSL